MEKISPPVPKLTLLSICRGRAGPCLGRSVQGQGSLAGSPGRGTARLPLPWQTSTGRGSLAGLLMGSGKRRQISDLQRCHVASQIQHLQAAPAPPQIRQAGPPGKREPRDTLSSLADPARGYPTWHLLFFSPGVPVSVLPRNLGSPRSLFSPQPLKPILSIRSLS